MSTDFSQQIAKPVVRLDEIVALRAHLEKKYPDRSPKERADMLAESIYKMLDASMAGLEPEQKLRIRKQMVRQYLIESKQSILKLDVLNQVLRMPEIKPEQMLSRAWGWYVMNTGHSIPMNDFTESITPYLPSEVRKIVRELSEEKEILKELKPAPIPIAPIAPPAAELPLPKPAVKKRKYRLAKKYRFTAKGWATIGTAIVILLLAGSLLAHGYYWVLARMAPEISPKISLSVSPLFPPEHTAQTVIGKPEYLKFKNVRLNDLKDYLETKDSALLNGDYLALILKHSQDSDINPLLLVAILGQEQGYVPKEHRYADVMLKNPFNIYGSWETHRIGFDRSIGEACFTINAALNKRTYYQDPFEVINQRYAEDPNWRLGVKLIFLDLMAHCMNNPVR